MKARVAGIAGSVLALTVIGGFAAASTFQSAPAAPVRVVQPAVVETAAVAVAPTTQAPVVAAPAPVVSTQAPVVVAPKPKVVAVPKVVQSAPVVAAPAPAFKQPGIGATKPPGGWSTAAGTYPDGTPLQYDAAGNVIPFAP
jgi:hypothetical protein